MSEGGIREAGVRDPGLQPERTRLAWRRTTLSSTVAALLAGKTALHGGPSAAGIAVCAVCCALWLCFLAVAHRRIRTLATTDDDGPPVLAARHAAAATLCAVALAVCGAALVL
ncbi:DUF202 domain-containing protein [Streptomyces sp. ADMS]|uniref:DUF202 domain-containing protein n=1 Tax=Streptomyces sp. ADMS TaxID=3071415 RepID=UPI00296E3755|nr:DUF202 domain-containing protein [Streptomyces sp. ADMS]MDW4908138.1 DUF202 domain-containing protein [Streptomyces sp. ADMS]